MPPTTESRLPSGCLLALLVYLAVCLPLLRASWPLLLLLVLPALLLSAYFLHRLVYARVLLLVARRRWVRRGFECLVVRSDSPLWAAHIQSQWLPRFGHLAILLNWSERASWRRNSLAVRVFDRFCGRRENFCPAVVVFRRSGQPHVFRFYNAFREVKAGRDDYLRRMESELLQELGIEADGQ